MASEIVLSRFPLTGAVALVTGANRGIGQALARELLTRGAAKVYAGVRGPSPAEDSRIVPVRLDVTEPAQVAAAADQCGDVTLLVNNAGICLQDPLIGAPSAEEARQEMEVNFFGPLAMMRAFAPVLGRNGGGAIVNVLSALSFVNWAPWGAYCASKAAAWSMTNSARDELAAQGTRVLAVHSSLVDTAMSAGVALELPRMTREEFAAAALQALEAGRIEVLVDAHTRTFKAMLSEYPHNQPG